MTGNTVNRESFLMAEMIVGAWIETLAIISYSVIFTCSGSSAF